MDQKNYIEINSIIGANEKTEISLKQLQIWQFLAALYFLRFQKSPNLPLSLAAKRRAHKKPQSLLNGSVASLRSLCGV